MSHLLGSETAKLTLADGDLPEPKRFPAASHPSMNVTVRLDRLTGSHLDQAALCQTTSGLPQNVRLRLSRRNPEFPRSTLRKLHPQQNPPRKDRARKPPAHQSDFPLWERRQTAQSQSSVEPFGPESDPLLDL